MAHSGARREAGSGPAWTVRRFDSIDSTNRYLIDQARRGAHEGLVAVADHQTAGRGRLGRTWLAEPRSSLLVSVLLRPHLPIGLLHLCTVVVALSASDACQEVAGVSPGLKWPNDLVLGDRKLAGVLAEVEFDGPELGAVVVGLGLNLAWSGAVPEEIATSSVALGDMAEAGHVERDHLLEAFLRHLAGRYVELADEGGRARQALGYRSRCITIGRPVRVELSGETFSGTAADITSGGHLMVETGYGFRTVAAGDVIHLLPGP